MIQKLIKKVRKKLFKKGSDENVKEVLKGGTVAFLYRLATMAVSYGLIFFITKKLGNHGMGIYSISVAVLVILVMIGCLGFNTSVVRFVSQYNTQQRYVAIRQLYSAMMRITLPLSIGLGLLLFIFAEPLAVIGYKDTDLILPFRITAFIIPLMVLSTINVEFIRGFKLVHVSELFRNLTTQAVALAALIVASYFVLEPHHPVAFYGVGWGVSAIFTFLFIRRILKAKLKLETQEPQAPFSLHHHLMISLPMILTSFIQLINGKVDTLMLGIVESTAVVGVFAVAYKISDITNFAIGALKTIAMPKISELFWSDKKEELNQVVQYSTRVVFLFSAPVCIAMLVFPESILTIIDKDLIDGAWTLRIFAVTQLVNALSGMVAVFLNMTGNQVYFTRLVAITTGMNIVLNLILIPLYGMEGAAIATFISVISWNVAGAQYIYRKYRITTFFNPFMMLKREKKV